jgi:phospholipase D1/2
VEKKGERKGPAWGKILVAVLVIAGLTAAWRYTPLSELITGERISAWARTVREIPWAPFALVLAYTPAAFIMFPRPVLTLIGVIAFGPWLGFAYAMAGVLTSALATYYVGRALPRRTVKNIAGDKAEDVSQQMQNHGILAVAALRFLPTAPYGVEGMIVGTMRVKVWDYVLGTMLGMGPGVLATTVFGTQITNFFEDPSTINYWILGATVVVFVALSWAVGRWLTKRKK